MDELAQEVMKISVRLLDEAYGAWLAAQSECDRALRAWFDGTSANRSAAYRSYRASLDREEAATCDLQRLSELVEPAESLLAQDDRTGLTRSVRPVEHKVATVMFVDVKGSLDMSRRSDLESWWSLIDRLFELMCENVYGFGGWVGNFTGDGINAVFDARPDQECHARRACHAALTIRDAIRVAAAELHDARGIELLVRIGMNSGEVITGTLGERYKRCYTANGYVVGLAKRIEALAPPDHIYLGEHTASLVRGWARLHDRGSFDVKGAGSHVSLFELVS